jgi:hypothetical protein
LKRRYVTIDVFTDRMFGGNPLAVVLDAAGLSTSQMQAIAIEFNYSETTFILPPKHRDHSAWVRIFTPGSEIPFAGHPNVGTAFALAGILADRNERVPEQFVFEEEAGLVPVTLSRQSRNQTGGRDKTLPRPCGQFWMIRRSTSAQFVPANAGAKAKNPVGSTLFSTPMVALIRHPGHKILRTCCRESARKRLMEILKSSSRSCPAWYFVDIDRENQIAR